jgi:hypothetical protein
MRFEARDLKPYAEPVSADELEAGAVYFSLTFVDDEMLLPSMQPLVFIGRDLEAEDTGQVYFQDVGSYRRGVRYESAGLAENAVFTSGSEEELGHIFKYEQALEVLMACSLRRRKTSDSAGSG